MATDELTSISFTCGGSKGTVLVPEWYGTRDHATGASCAPNICKVTF